MDDGGCESVKKWFLSDKNKAASCFLLSQVETLEVSAPLLRQMCFPRLKKHPSIIVIGHFTPTDPICLNLRNQCW